MNKIIYNGTTIVDFETLVPENTHQDMSDDYDPSTLGDDKPVSYAAIKDYIDSKIAELQNSSNGN